MLFSNCSESLSKDIILHKNKDIKTIFETCRVIKSHLLCFYYIESKNEKVAFIISKRVGKACWRNKIKRWLREIYRQNKGHFVGIHIIFYVKYPLQANFSDLKNDILSKEFY